MHCFQCVIACTFLSVEQEVRGSGYLIFILKYLPCELDNIQIAWLLKTS